MASPERTLADVLQDLARDGHVSDADVAGVNSQARAVLQQEKTPWFLQPFIFLGAMIAAAMFSIAFVLLVDINNWEAVQLSCAGAVYLVVAVLLHRRRLNIYTDALALALSLGGHGFVMAAVIQAQRSWSTGSMTAFLVFLGLCATLYFLYRDGLHRYLTVALVLALAKAAFSREDLDQALHGFVLLTMCVAAWALTRNRELPQWRPLAHGCCTGLVVLLLPLGDRRHGPELTRHAMTHPWISSILVGIALLWILHWVSQRPGLKQQATIAQQAMAVLVTAGLAALSTPGLLAALFLAVLGHGTHHWRITMLGLMSLPIFLWKYYYDLDLDFLAKSGVLAATGAVLLIARWAITYSRWLRPDIAGAEAE